MSGEVGGGFVSYCCPGQAECAGVNSAKSDAGCSLGAKVACVNRAGSQEVSTVTRRVTWATGCDVWGQTSEAFTLLAKLSATFFENGVSLWHERLGVGPR